MTVQRHICFLLFHTLQFYFTLFQKSIFSWQCHYLPIFYCTVGQKLLCRIHRLKTLLYAEPAKLHSLAHRVHYGHLSFKLLKRVSSWVAQNQLLKIICGTTTVVFESHEMRTKVLEHSSTKELWIFCYGAIITNTSIQASSVSSVQLLSHVWLFASPRTAACQASLSITNSWSLLKLMSIEFVMPSNHLILCHPLLLTPSIFSSIRVFSNESVLHIIWPKCWSFSFSISPSNEYSGLISFRMDWLDLLAVRGTLKSLLQHHSSKASILQHSAFFIVQLSLPYMTTAKTIALTWWPLLAK